MSDFRRESQEVIYSGPVFTLTAEVFSSPEGERFDRQFVRHGGAVAVVPLHDDGSVTLIRQYRPAVDRRLLEIPAGLLDHDGESLPDAAARELQEEVGLRASAITPLLGYLPAPGMTDEHVTLFVATGLVEVAPDRQGPEEDDLEVIRLPLTDAVAMVRAGEIADGKTALGLLLVATRDDSASR